MVAHSTVTQSYEPTHSPVRNIQSRVSGSSRLKLFYVWITPDPKNSAKPQHFFCFRLKKRKLFKLRTGYLYRQNALWWFSLTSSVQFRRTSKHLSYRNLLLLLGGNKPNVLIRERINKLWLAKAQCKYPQMQICKYRIYTHCGQSSFIHLSRSEMKIFPLCKIHCYLCPQRKGPSSHV